MKISEMDQASLDKSIEGAHTILMSVFHFGLFSWKSRTDQFDAMVDDCAFHLGNGLWLVRPLKAWRCLRQLRAEKIQRAKLLEMQELEQELDRIIQESHNQEMALPPQTKNPA